MCSKISTMSEKTETTWEAIKRKFLSRRFFACLWAMVMISIIVITNRPEFETLATVLAGAIGVWLGFSSASKKGVQQSQTD